MRPHALRRRLWSLAVLTVLIGAGVGLSARAHADGYITDTEAAYILAYGPTAICPVITEFPSKAGVYGVANGIMADGFAADDAVDIINASVARYCDEYWPLLVQIGAEARGDTRARYIA